MRADPRRENWCGPEHDTPPRGVVRKSASDVRKLEWLKAVRWRRKVEAALAESGLTFTQWLVLEAIRELNEETDEDPIQNEIALRVELDRATVSPVIQLLGRKRLLDRGVDRHFAAWSVTLNERAEVLLRSYRQRIDELSLATL
jgi:DNA-binding MarR family transcriptional regulator